MDVADEETVLGDFDDATFTHYGVTSTFFRRDGKFFVRTDGPDGELQDYEIIHTFGVRPLQQYLIEFPGGRLQALSLCWDSRPAEEGGQRWFHLYPDEAIRHDDPLHWTAPSQNWNYMCAECHSTNLRKGYDLEEDRFGTTWSEIDVSCEACHGPGSNHVAWAEAAPENRRDDDSMGLELLLGDRDGGRWVMDRGTGVARRSEARSSWNEIETCARCHARRSSLHDEYAHGGPLLNTHRLALLEPRLYHADGQILDEVYVHGSFLQSRMYREGVTCSDCHDPHGLRPHGTGNAVCAGCHLSSRYDDPSHHSHDPDTEGAQCASCHMVKQTYMVVDPRGDHSFRVPRPDLSVTIGVPNACNGCHTERSPEWAADAIAAWRGPEWSPEAHYGEVLHAGRERLPEAEVDLARLVGDPSEPAIVRATALAMLAPSTRPAKLAAVERGLRDEDPIVRAAALDALAVAPGEAAVQLAAPLLDDPVRLVRTTAAWVLAPFAATLDEIGERPEPHVNLGTLYARLGDFEDADRAFETALRIDPGFVPAYVNYADLHRAQGRDDLAEEVLRRALEVADDGDVHHALGLALVRQKKYREAVDELELAVELSPGRARYGYVLGVALNDLGRRSRAIEVLEAAHGRHPADRDILHALVTITAEDGNREAAIVYAEKLVELAPDDPGARQLLNRLRAPQP
jgi:tetratricopeptide (TPR) repeat protein